MAKKRLNKIKIVLVAKNKKVKWLAQELGMNYTTVTNYCRNSSQPSLATLYKIAEILKVEVSDLVYKLSEIEQNESGEI